MLTIRKNFLINIAVTTALSFGSLASLAQDTSAEAQTQPAKKEATLSMQELLQAVKQGRVYDAKVNDQRLREFRADQATQQEKLRQLDLEQQRAEAKSAQLEKTFQKNDEAMGELESSLEKRLGSVKELFGVLQLVASDAHAQMSNSVSDLEYSERKDSLLAFANKMGQTKHLPKIQEIENLWFELQREMLASGQVKSIDHPVVGKTGTEAEQSIVRVGLFNLISEGNYLQFVPETGRVLEYGRQPNARYMQGAGALSKESASPNGEPVMVAIDPTRGQLLSMLVKAPSLTDRIQQGGVIGYIIIAMGIGAVLLAVQRSISLALMHSKVNAQIKKPDQPGNNPLGRILSAYHDNKQADPETLELKMGEAILKEVPKVNRNLPLLKIIAAVAPLMGLLGTVTGMIITFQAITLFGAGDPKLMANGISQALVTTVLGLTVAIPTLLLHNFVQTKARSITEVLEQESIALVANHLENQEA